MRGSARLKGQRKKGLLMWNSTVVVGDMGKRKKQIFLSRCSRGYCEGRKGTLPAGKCCLKDVMMLGVFREVLQIKAEFHTLTLTMSCDPCVQREVKCCI